MQTAPPWLGWGVGGASGQETNLVRPRGPLPALHRCPCDPPRAHHPLACLPVCITKGSEQSKAVEFRLRGRVLSADLEWNPGQRRTEGAWGRRRVIVFNTFAPIVAPETPESRDGTSLGNPNPTPLLKLPVPMRPISPTQRETHLSRPPLPPLAPRGLDSFLGLPVLTPVCSPTNRARSS